MVGRQCTVSDDESGTILNSCRRYQTDKEKKATLMYKRIVKFSAHVVSVWANAGPHSTKSRLQRHDKVLLHAFTF